ncbi:hypothetical protein PSU4_60120 [Pseudonocardia sulfidoxydans NBRC 16205]|uniref:DUF6879 domain-containing protein n=1 Tax=Pseudonocardia sulfidoxydans NBRC 16205 TaxID=1223511 RepID=A0A511DVD3_9PSEU|nr:DUF6879 family protein [Pseudonocardia sulfidoxydans]GEL27058.1 hypothetical protein PSU4_60120 [Pseudonocardia sulfidoxydans NBRC 16205]
MTTLADLFARFHQSAWRYEGHDTYVVSGEEGRIATYLRGEPLPRKTRENNSWIATVEDIRARKARISRVRVVGHPLTDYTRFEFAAYPDNVRAGEDVDVIDRALLAPEWRAVPDFWLFDDATVFVQHFDDDGRFLGAEQAEDPQPFLEVRRLLTGHTTPLDRYQLTDLPQQRSVPVVGPPPKLPTPAIRR